MADKRISRNKVPGSPVSGEPEYVLIGKLQRAHGVTGEIVLGIKTDFPERIKPGKLVYLGGDFIPHKITGSRPFHNNLLIILEGVKNREEAAEMTNLDVFVRTRDLPDLGEGRYYHHQLVGLKAILEDGSTVGTVQDILITGANDVYVITDSNGKEILLPAIDAVIVNIDLEKEVIVVKPPEWE